jgi:hypothetical protein
VPLPQRGVIQKIEQLMPWDSSVDLAARGSTHI